MKYCTNCGHQMADDMRFCPECGTKTEIADEPVQEVPTQAIPLYQSQPQPQSSPQYVQQPTITPTTQNPQYAPQYMPQNTQPHPPAPATQNPQYPPQYVPQYAQPHTFSPPGPKPRRFLMGLSIFFFFCAGVMLLQFLIGDYPMIDGTLGYGILGVMFLLLSKTPKGSTYLFGKEKGLNKVLFIFICIFLLCATMIVFSSDDDQESPDSPGSEEIASASETKDPIKGDAEQESSDSPDLEQIVSASETENSIDGATESDDYHPEGVFVESEVLEQLKVTEYTYNGSWSYYHFIEVENGSEFDLEISISVKFYNDAGELVGAKSDSEDAIEHGHKMLFYFIPDEAYATTEYEITVAEEEFYDCVLSDLSYESVPAQEKEIVSVTNNGTEAAEFVECYMLFFMNGNVVGFETQYFTDDDFELKPGKTITEEMDCYEPYDSYLIYFTGRR